MLHRLKTTFSILLLVFALFDILISFGIAHGRGVAYTTETGTCFGFTLFESHYRLFNATHREAGITGIESITYPGRSLIFYPRGSSSKIPGFETEDRILDHSEYDHPFPPPGTPQAHVQAILIPHWPILCPGLGIPFLIWFTDYRRRRQTRIHNHLCPTCNYDLRAHAPNAICPECGTVVPAKPATLEIDQKTP